MSESNNNIPMRITQLEEATEYPEDAYYPIAKAGWGTKKIPASIVNNKIANLEDIITSNLMSYDLQENLYMGAADWSGSWITTDSVHVTLSDETHNGYPVMYSSESWRRYYKEIPVEAGKTYTFQACIKTPANGTVYAYALYENITSPATVSPTRKAYTTIANEWKTISVTFTCSVSGNVSPLVLCSTGAFYFSQYIFVEGDKVLNITDELAKKLNNNLAIGDYKRYEFALETSPGLYWNTTLNKPITQGTKVKLVFDTYSGNDISYIRIDGKKSDSTFTNNLCKIQNPTRGDSAEFVAPENYVALRVQIYRTTSESNVSAVIYIATNEELGITYELLGTQKIRVYHVEKDGSGDFTKLVDAIQEATKYLDSIVYLGAGEWDIISEFGNTYMDNVSSDKTTWGLYLKNRIHLIGSSNSIVKAVYTGNNANVTQYFAAFNAGKYGFTMENINIVDDHIRYSVHDDRGNSFNEQYSNKYINCSMKHTNGMYGDCIGGGLGINGLIEIRNCYFEGDANVERLVYYHGNNYSGATDAQCKMIVTDNYFANSGSFKLTKYGDSTKVSTAYVSNNSLGAALEVNSGSYAPNDNMELIAWNNEVRS